MMYITMTRSLLVLLVSVSLCHAQQELGNSIHGTVTDAISGKPIEKFRVIKGDVTLLARGGSRGAARFDPETAVNFQDGKYDIPYPSRIPSSGGRAFVLRFEADGYEPEESQPVRATPMGIDDTTCNIKLRKALPLHGTIKSPDGKPAAGAEVFLVSDALPLRLENNRVKLNDPIRGVQAGVRSVQSSLEGEFSIARDTTKSILVVMHELGFAVIRDPALPVDEVAIQLEQWGRIAGSVHNGERPAAGQVVGLVLEASQAQSTPIGLGYTTTANADGQFVFDRVFPQSYAIGKIAPSVRQGVIIQELAVYGPVVVVDSGKTIQAELGNKGRGVTGKAAIEGETQSRPLAPVAVRIYSRRGDPKTPQERQAYLANRRVYDTQLKADGSFVIESIEPGQYTMLLRGVADAEANPRLNGRPAIHDYQADILVPPISKDLPAEILNLGEIRFRIPQPGR